MLVLLAIYCIIGLLGPLAYEMTEDFDYNNKRTPRKTLALVAFWPFVILILLGSSIFCNDSHAIFEWLEEKWGKKNSYFSNFKGWLRRKFKKTTPEDELESQKRLLQNIINELDNTLNSQDTILKESKESIAQLTDDFSKTHYCKIIERVEKERDELAEKKEKNSEILAFLFQKERELLSLDKLVDLQNRVRPLSAIDSVDEESIIERRGQVLRAIQTAFESVHEKELKTMAKNPTVSAEDVDAQMKARQISAVRISS